MSEPFNLYESKYGAQNLLVSVLSQHWWGGLLYFTPVETEPYFHGTASPTPGSIFTSSPYARICKRYQEGQLTDQPLWPWPMNQRIKEAVGHIGQSSGRCDTNHRKDVWANP